MRNRYYYSILLTVALGAMIAALCGCSRDAEEAPPVIRPVRTIEIAAPGKGRELSFSGTVRAAVETKLSFRGGVSGEIDKLPAKIGLKVKAGDLIASLEPTDYTLEVKQSKAQLASAEAELKTSKFEYNRSRQLYESESLAKGDLDKAQAAFETAKAQVDAAKEGLSLARQKLSYCTLRAPMDGTIGSVPVEIHYTVSSGTTVATLSGGDELRMEIGLPESLIGRIKLGDDASATFDAIPGKQFKLDVVEVGSETTESMTYTVKLRILDDDKRIRIGMVGDVKIVFAAVAGGEYIVVPPVAVVGDPGGDRHVWIYIKDKGVVSKRKVEIGAITSAGLQIKSGLNTGDILVVRGSHLMEEGMQVKLLDAPMEKDQ